MNNNKVLVIDDDPLAFEIIKGTLKDSFTLFHALDGEQGLAMQQEHDPFLILLDIEMPGMSGFDVCEALRAKSLPEQPYVIFISAHNTSEERLHAYSSGGDDFILKPLSPREVLFKTQLASEAQQDLLKLQASAQEAMSAAMSAISEIGSMGIILKLFRQLFASNEMTEVVNALLAAMHDLGLKGVVQCKDESSQVVLNTEGRSSQMEKVLLDGLSGDERHVVDYGTRTAFNFPSALVLVKNMPVDDEEQLGRLRDLVAQMTEGASGRLTSIAREKRSTNSDNIRYYHADVLNILGDARRSLTDVSHELLLSPDQEDALLEVVSEATRRINHSLQALTRG